MKKHTKKVIVVGRPYPSDETPIIIALYAPITDQMVKSFHTFNKIVYDDIIKCYGYYLGREYLIKGNEGESLIDYTYLIASHAQKTVIDQLNDYLQKVDVLKNNVKFECQTSLSGETNI